jgi:hypothetical protein
MEYKPLAEPFNIAFEKEGIEYKAKIVYAKSATSCTNFYKVEIEFPRGIAPFCLTEKPVHNGEHDSMVWMDDAGRESDFYQLIGYEIVNQMKDQLGVLLIDTPLGDKQDLEDY